MEVEVELVCNRCERETPHRAQVGDGFLKALTCSVCGAVTQMPAPVRTAETTARPAPPPVQFAPFSFGRGPKSQVILGSGPVLVEGSIHMHGQTRAVALSVDVMAQATRLREADCHLIRLPVSSPQDIPALKAVHVAIPLPVAVDVGVQLDLLPQVAAAHPDAIIATVWSAGQAGKLGPFADIPLFVRVGQGGEGAEELAGLAEVVCRTLQAAGVTRVAVSLNVGDLAHLAEAYHALLRRVQVPLRPELSSQHITADHARAYLLLGSLVAEGLGAILAPVGAPDPAKAVDEIAELLKAIGYLELVYGRDRSRIFRYYTRRTLDRLISKPGRLAAQLGADPNAFVSSLPRRALTKPLRLVQEFRRILNKIS